ncbi:hypothetical protein KC356_g3880 [Hortaea werneckii]|nr:hypothetical protein KC356_g3880 [Hortaea werneckii]
MAIRQYTVEQLKQLQYSPLAKKPEALPAIEQWIEYVYLDVGHGEREKLRIPHSESQQQHQPQPQQHVPHRQNGTGRQQRPNPTAGESPMGNFSTGQRPSLMQTRGSSVRSGEDITLGPPKTLFASSRTVSRLADFDKPASPLTEANVNEEQELQRGGSRFFGDKGHRKGMGTSESDGRHNRESWTTAREKRQAEEKESGERGGRFGRRDHDGERRNGFGDKQDTRWGPRDRDDRAPNGERRGGWRERERERRDRDFDRGQEREPEWMDNPMTKQEDDLGSMSMPKNQEDFEKWKQAQHARNKKSTSEAAPEPSPADPPMESKEIVPPKPTTAPLKLDPVVAAPFGGLNSFGRPEGSAEGAQTPAKTSTAKSGKTSRFMPMFKKEEPREEIAAPVEPQTSGPAANGSAEDKEGFQRILQMLGGANISQAGTPNEPSSPASRHVSNGTAKRQSRFTGFFDQTPKSPERLQSPPQGPSQGPPRGMDSEMLQTGGVLSADPAGMFGGRLPDQRHQAEPLRPPPPPGMASPEPTSSSSIGRGPQSRPQSGRLQDLFLEKPPSRGTASTPDLNLQNLLASQRHQRPQGPDKNSEFLLNLLQTKGSSRPPSQTARPDSNFPLWLDQPPSMPETHAPKPGRAPPPPGLFEDQLLRNHQQEPSRQEQPRVPMNEGPERRPAQRIPPPGFYDQQELFMQQQQQQQQQQQRRHFTEPPQFMQQGGPGRRMSGHPNLPQMQIPAQQQGPPPFPPHAGEYLTSPTGPGQGPPPGFNPHMPRHPPGFANIPNIFSAPQPQPPPPNQQLPRDPPGFSNVGAGPGSMASPPNAPPGFFGGPQGMAPPGFMPLRSPPEGMPAGNMRGGSISARGGFAPDVGYDATQRR